MKKYWLSSKSMTIEVGVRSEGWNNKKVVAAAPPIAKRFVGQPLGNLVAWMQKQGDFEMKAMDPRDTND